MRQLTVCITSTIRPELLSLTLRSFYTGVFYQFEHIRILGNLDPLHEENTVARKTCKNLLNLFDTGGRAFVFEPSHANFNSAVKRLWSHALDQSQSSGYFLHLEDDWFLYQNVPRASIEEILAPQGIASARLFLKRVHRPELYSGFSLNPSFIKFSVAQQALSQWASQGDPEKMLDGLNLGKTVLYQPECPWLPCVSDIGTYWRKSRGIQKTYSRTAGKITSSWTHDQVKATYQGLETIKYRLRHQITTGLLWAWQTLREFRATFLSSGRQR
jgi:hypothetical protein